MSTAYEGTFESCKRGSVEEAPLSLSSDVMTS